MSVSRAEQAEATPDFQAGLASIVGKPLTVETIDTYAESALEDLGEFVQQVADSYPVRGVINGKDLEDAACAYFGLEHIEETLDHIADKAREIHDLETVITAVDTINEIILPPDASRTIEPGSGGGVEDREVAPRLKTLLFILANDFDIDIHDRRQLTITHGNVDDTMMRRESYYLVQAPKLQRAVLICDELDNATFVLDDQGLKEHAIGTEELMRLTKKELQELLEADPSLGQRLVQRQHFVPNLIKALVKAPINGQESLVDNAGTESAGRYLAPKPPENILSLYGLYNALEAGRAAVEEAVEALGDELGEARMYRFGRHILPGYDQAQQERVRQYLEESGHYDRPPEGYLHSYELSKLWGPGVSTIRDVALELGEDLGALRTFTNPNGGRRVEYFSPEQQSLLRASLEAAGNLEDKAPEGVLSVLGLAKQYKVYHSTILKMLEDLGEDLGDTRTYKFGSRTVVGYSPAQQELVRQRLETGGFLVPKAPEGVVSLLGMSKLPAFHIGASALRRIAKSLREELGEIQQYRFGPRGRIAEGYTPEQQAFIKARLEKKGLVDPPNDHMDIPALEEHSGISYSALYKAIDKLDSELGPVVSYKGGRGAAPHYSPHQQEVIIQDVIRRSIKSVKQ